MSLTLQSSFLYCRRRREQEKVQNCSFGKMEEKTLSLEPKQGGVFQNLKWKEDLGPSE